MIHVLLKPGLVNFEHYLNNAQNTGDSEVAQLCPTLRDPMDCIAYQAPPSMGFSRQEYWSGLPFPSPGESSQPRDQTRVSTFQADALTAEPPG